MKLFAVIPINRKTKKEMPPRFDLRPMNHQAACNWMDACRNRFTDYMLIEWPKNTPHPGEPLLSDNYRKEPLYA